MTHDMVVVTTHDMVVVRNTESLNTERVFYILLGSSLWKTVDVEGVKRLFERTLKYVPEY